MKTIYPADQETYARIGEAYLICSQYPEVFGDVPMDKFCSMFTDNESKQKARINANAPEMYELLKVWTTIGVQPDLREAQEKARKLLARIDGEEDNKNV